MPKQRWEQPGLAVTYFFLCFFHFCRRSAGCADARSFCLEINERRLALWHFGSHAKG